MTSPSDFHEHVTIHPFCDVADVWNPLEGFDDEDPFEVHLNVHEMYGIGVRAREIADSYDLGSFPVFTTRVEGEEVGDDRIDLSGNPLQLAVGLMCQEQACGMKTSDEDTFISNWLWNFCEVSSQVPVAPEESFDAARKSGNFQSLGFTDVPPLRIILDVMKGDRSHSSTAVGKMTMLGSRGRTPRTEFLRDFHLASFLQDGHLRTSRATDPKYLPQIMGGSGVRALFSNPLNQYLFVHAYRGGRYQRIYGSATRELRQSLDSLEKGDRVIMPILCRRLRDRQEYLHGTYDAKILIPPKSWMDKERNELPDPLIMASGGANRFASFENRLLRTKHLLTRTSAEIEWENTLRLRSRLLERGMTTVQSEEQVALHRKRARSKFDMALNSNAALANLLNRHASLQDVMQLIKDEFTALNCGATHFSEWDSKWLFFGGKSENYSIEDLTSSEDLYLRTEVSEEESMKVGNILLRPIVGRTERRVVTTTTVGLYQIGSGMYEWASNLANRLVQLRNQRGSPLGPEAALSEYEKDPEWVNDDSLIIERCRRDHGGRSSRTTVVGLVSADVRLAHQLANTCNVRVVAIHPFSYILWAERGSQNPVEEPTDSAQLRGILPDGLLAYPAFKIYVDTGSVNAFLSRMDVNPDGLLVQRIPIATAGGMGTSQPRSTTYQLLPIPDRYFGRYRIHDPVMKPKRFRGTGPLSVESSSRRSVLSPQSLSSIRSWRSGI